MSATKDDAMFSVTMVAELIAAKDRRIAELEAECKEAWRRRDAWKAKASAYPEMAAAVHAKIKNEPATMSRVLLRAGYADMQARIAELEAALAGAREAALEEAAKLIDQRLDDYMQEFGIYDWEELAAAIRSMKGTRHE